MSNLFLVSIIVPIYKVEEFLPTCIESIISQTYHNLEIILVNDGSPDNCGKICDEYAEKDIRIKVLHRENGGLSDARNAGLDFCKGEYILFVDSDDFINLDLVSLMMNNIGSSPIVMCDFETFFYENKIIESSLDFSEPQIFEKSFIIDNFTTFKSPLFIVAWNKLYHRSIWNKIRYPKGKIHEDEYVIHEILNLCREIVYLSVPLYYYRQREGSITNSPERKIERLLTFTEIYKNRVLFFRENDHKNALQNALLDLKESYFLIMKEIEYSNLPIEVINYFDLNYNSFSMKYKLKYYIFKYFKFILPLIVYKNNIISIK